MKKLASLACCVFLGAFAHSECVTADAQRPLEHSPHLLIVVELGEKPLQGVKVDLYAKGSKKATFHALTNERGMVIPPALDLGDYSIVAALNQAVVSSLQLRITRGGADVPLSISLGSVPMEVIESQPIRDRLQEFRGVVLDQADAAIPAAIVVVSRGPRVGDVVLRITADMDGHFSEKLGDGFYTAFFFANGFRTATLPFEITGNGAGQLQVRLRVGGC